jgi:hypothetical protein
MQPERQAKPGEEKEDGQTCCLRDKQGQERKRKMGRHAALETSKARRGIGRWVDMLPQRQARQGEE